MNFRKMPHSGWFGLVSLVLVVSLSGCAINRPVHSTGKHYIIDKSRPSENKDNRIRYLILHYTAADTPRSLDVLTQARYKVSAHYLVPDQPENLRDNIFSVKRLVPEVDRAWHAGVSYWNGETMLNSSSIGIEIVNMGFPENQNSFPPMQRSWYPYSPQQITAVGELARDIVHHYKISPINVLGHSDIAPGRKSDPGPLFPWKELYDRFGIGAWPDPKTVSDYQQNHPYDGDIKALQVKLSTYGYSVPQTGELDTVTTNAIIAFQMHFRPTLFDGVPDVETVAILDALLLKYRSPSPLLVSRH